MFNPFKRKKKSQPTFEPIEGPGLESEMSGPPLRPERRMPPTNEVRALASRGVPEPDIIRTLRSEGYTTSEIDQAMKEALRSRVTGDFYGPPKRGYEPSMPQPPPQERFPPREEIPPALGYPGAEFEESRGPEPSFEPEERGLEIPEIPEREIYPEPYPPPTGRMRVSPQKGIDRREIEEFIEVVVEEKTREIKERFKSTDMQIQQLLRKIDSFSEELNRIRSEKNSEIKAIESKIDGYSKNMEEMAGRIESMEKALRDSIAPMLESLRSLSELVKSLKEKSK
jgi:DNA-binding transcriptional MerR regulator